MGLYNVKIDAFQKPNCPYWIWNIGHLFIVEFRKFKSCIEPGCYGVWDCLVCQKTKLSIQYVMLNSILSMIGKYELVKKGWE